MTRSIDDIMKNVSEKMSKRNPAENKEANEAPCLCQGRYYFIKRKENGERFFEVCPHCNPRLTCKICDSTGNLIQKNKVTGATEAIPNGCECVVWEARTRKLNAANIPEKYLLAEFSFDNIQYGKKHLSPNLAEKFEENQAQIRDFCEHADNVILEGVNPGDKYTLGLVGPVGSGKTYLGVCALKDLIWHYGHNGKFIDFQALIHKIRDSYTKNLSEDEIMEPLRRVDVLMIDEFGKGRAEKEWENEKLDDLVNSRYNNGRVTILTTNYVPKHLSINQIHSRQNADRGAGKTSSQTWFLGEENGSKTSSADGYQVITLSERIGERMYDRIQETTVWVDFTGISSFRKKMAEDFLVRMNETQDPQK